MKKYQKEYLKKVAGLTIKEFFYFLFQTSIGVSAIFNDLTDLRRIHRRDINKYWENREIDHIKFSHQLYYFKKQKYIEIYKENKKTFIELTAIGKAKAIKYIINDIKIAPPQKWDQKWRMVIFDIPKEKNNIRDCFRRILIKIGFYQLQKSVFIYPHDVFKEINYFRNIYNTGAYVKYIIADRFEGEEELIKYFLDREILTFEHIKANKTKRTKK